VIAWIPLTLVARQGHEAHTARDVTALANRRPS
jgi:hypothetical protein